MKFKCMYSTHIQSFAKVSDHLKNMLIWQLKLIIASSAMTKHMYTREHFCHRLKRSHDALLYMSFESRTPNFRLIDVGFAY